MQIPAPAPPPPPAMHAPPPQQPVMQMPAPMPMPPPRQLFREPPAAPFGAGSFSAELAQARAKSGGGSFLKAAIALLVLAGAGGGYWYWSTTNKPGRIEVTATPDDATVLVDNTKVGDHAPVQVERPPGHHTISVVREGYVRYDKPVEVLAGAPLPLTVALEPSPDTGFELTSEPPGGLVWLDGAAIKGAAGQQARTDFRAFRIAPGHHVLEIKGETRFKPWREDVEVEPDKMVKVHAMLIPASGGAPSGKSSSHQEVAEVSAPPAPPPPAAKPTAPPPPAAKPPAPPVTAEAVVPPPPPPAPHVTHHKKPREAAADEGSTAPVAAASDDDSGAKADKAGDCTMTVNSVPWSEVWIDGKNTTQHTPIVDYKIPCGRHKLAFKRSDMQIDHSESINLKPGQAFKQRYTLATDE